MVWITCFGAISTFTGAMRSEKRSTLRGEWAAESAERPSAGEQPESIGAPDNAETPARRRNSRRFIAHLGGLCESLTWFRAKTMGSENSAARERRGDRIAHRSAIPRLQLLLGQSRVIASAPSAETTTTNHGGHFQNINKPKATRPRPKSAGEWIALVQTGLYKAVSSKPTTAALTPFNAD